MVHGRVYGLSTSGSSITSSIFIFGLSFWSKTLGPNPVTYGTSKLQLAIQIAMDPGLY